MRRTSSGDLFNSTLSFLDLAGMERPAAAAKGAGKPFGGKTPAERKKDMASKKGDWVIAWKRMKCPLLFTFSILVDVIYHRCFSRFLYNLAYHFSNSTSYPPFSLHGATTNQIKPHPTPTITRRPSGRRDQQSVTSCGRRAVRQAQPRPVPRLEADPVAESLAGRCGQRRSDWLRGVGSKTTRRSGSNAAVLREGAKWRGEQAEVCHFKKKKKVF